MKTFTDMLKLFAIPGALLLTGCATNFEGGIPDEDPVYPTVMIDDNKYDGAIYSSGTELALFEDIKAKRVGDILTVMLVEKTSGQNSADSSLSKSTAMDISTPTFGGSTRPNMAVDLNSGHSFSGESGSSQSNSLTGSIAVTVSQVLPGGNLVVHGEKWIQINQGREYIRLSGIVRPRDVGPDNMLYSTQVADARITYSGTGKDRDSHSPGWAARILFSPVWPF